MLEAMRRGAQTWVAKILFGLLVASFAIWGVADVFTGWGRGSLATVGDTQITAEDFQREFKNELDAFSREAKQKLTPEQGRAIGLDRRVISQLLGGAAIEQHAKQLGLGLSDQTLIEDLAGRSKSQRRRRQVFQGCVLRTFAPARTCPSRASCACSARTNCARTCSARSSKA